MNLYSMIAGPVDTNVYLLSDGVSGETALIDPAANGESILALAEEHHMTIKAIFVTHGHFDHIGAVDMLVKATSAPFYAPSKDIEILDKPDKNGSNSLEFLPVICRTTPIPLYDGDRISVGALTFSVCETPGHTQGSSCYFIEENGTCVTALTGDTVFADGYGRTDLYGGNHKAIWKSLHRLLPLLRGKTIYPGHGNKRTFEI